MVKRRDIPAKSIGESICRPAGDTSTQVSCSGDAGASVGQIAVRRRSCLTDEAKLRFQLIVFAVLLSQLAGLSDRIELAMLRHLEDAYRSVEIVQGFFRALNHLVVRAGRKYQVKYR